MSHDYNEVAPSFYSEGNSLHVYTPRPGEYLWGPTPPGRKRVLDGTQKAIVLLLLQDESRKYAIDSPEFFTLTDAMAKVREM